MADHCQICLRPLAGNQTGDERPCYMQAGLRCYELGFERPSAHIARLESDPVIRGRVDVMELAGGSRG